MPFTLHGTPSFMLACAGVNAAVTARFWRNRRAAAGCPGDAAPALADTLEDYEVSKAVGNVRNDSPELIEPVEP